VCLLVVAWQCTPGYRLVLAGNRDEFHDRPAAAAGWWDEATLGGRDLRAGGSWLGAQRSGRFAVVTNYREPLEEGRGPRSRGELVTAYLAGSDSPESFAHSLSARGRHYGGFNLLIGSPDALVYVSNRDRGPETLAPGVYGLSNHLLDTLWPKLRRTRQRFEALLPAGAPTTELLQILADREPAADGDLPETGIGPEWERLLSAPFIVSPRYGTRCSTVIRLTEDGEMDFTERRFDASGDCTGESSFAFPIRRAAA
jgi:uncharacterized protein with NRDE domain